MSRRHVNNNTGPLWSFDNGQCWSRSSCVSASSRGLNTSLHLFALFDEYSQRRSRDVTFRLCIHLAAFQVGQRGPPISWLKSSWLWLKLSNERLISAALPLHRFLLMCGKCDGSERRRGLNPAEKKKKESTVPWESSCKRDSSGHPIFGRKVDTGPYSNLF